MMDFSGKLWHLVRLCCEGIFSVKLSALQRINLYFARRFFGYELPSWRLLLRFVIVDNGLKLVQGYGVKIEYLWFERLECAHRLMMALL